MPEAPQLSPESTASETRTLKSTLNLPQTTFAMKANLPQNEPARLAEWQKNNLYAQIRAARAGAPKYILHDGPPYANGAIHLGHALNKCIKDFVVKTKTMAGFDAPYVPGWDCHGLPIEIKVDEQLGRKKLEMDPLAVRRACREYAQKYVDLQRSQFERIGVFGRWNDPYLTMSLQYEASIVETFYDFFENGFVYKGLKPVYWCIHDRTALAEAEVEYEQHTSPSVYIRYRLTSDPAAIDPALDSLPVYTIIWTTTPWTIPASQAVAFNPDLTYVALRTADAIYLVEETLAPSVIRAADLRNPVGEPVSEADILARFPGSKLEHTTFQHPFLDRSILGVVAPYVTADQGTGAVHTAPAHGVDDFATGKRYNLPELQYVDNAGRHRHTADPSSRHTAQPYEDLTVFQSNQPIIDLLRQHGALLSATSFEHSYPHCWRCHRPVIVRATEQWFISMETPMPAALPTPNEPSSALVNEPSSRLANEPSSRPEQRTASSSVAERRDPRISPAAPQSPSAPSTQQTGPSSLVPPPSSLSFRQAALNAIQQVKWDPSWGEERISNMIATRPDWCISRQRIWGVPIAVFLCDKCGEPLNDKSINRSIVELFHKEGADAWYIHDAATLLPSGTACRNCSHTEFRKEMDILDVWFESGASWHAVLEPEHHFPADLYTEGGDQHRGWFHSSLLTSVAMRGQAPYKMVATSGWTLDEQGRPFSKSLGNGVDPVDIAKRLGAEVVRLWVASVDFREDVAASENLMQRVSDNYRKLRNTLRFLLGNLHDFNPSTDAVSDFAKLEPLDQYILARLAELTAKIRKAYDDFEFHRAYHALNEFVNTDLSALYMDAVKDRLYTFPTAFKPGREYQHTLYQQRRSAQTALWRIAETLTRLIAPILSFTADEVWQHLPHVEGREPSVHLALFPSPSQAASHETERIKDDWLYLLQFRRIVLKRLEALRETKEIGKGLEAEVELTLLIKVPLFRRLSGEYLKQLPEVFSVSAVRIIEEFQEISEEAYAHYIDSGLLFHDENVFDSVVQIRVRPAVTPKCERCWRYVPDVGHSAPYPTVCLRCAEALDAIDFPPYTAQTPAEPKP